MGWRCNALVAALLVGAVSAPAGARAQAGGQPPGEVAPPDVPPAGDGDTGSPADEGHEPGAHGGGTLPDGSPDSAADVGAEEPSESPDEGPGEALSLDEEAAQIAAELAAMGVDEGGAGSTDEGSGAPAPAPASSFGLSNLLNPAISAVGLFYAGGSNRPGAPPGFELSDTGELINGLHIQEVELRLSAVVDPYFRADLTLSGSEGGVAFEEGYVSTLELPMVTIRLGQMYANLGRHGILHTHAYPFASAPLPWRRLLGPEALTDPGASADILLPLPFYVEINAQVFLGEWEPFAGSIPDDPATTLVDESVPDQRADEDLVYAGHLKTLFELGDEATLELGGTYLGGRNGFGELTSVVGADLTIKWSPTAAQRYTSFDWTTEWVWVNREGAPEDRSVGGAYTSVRIQFEQQFWIQARGAILGLPEGSGSEHTYRAEALFAFVPSEFSAIRLQYAFEASDRPALDFVHELFLQVIFSVGSHPAHAY